VPGAGWLPDDAQTARIWANAGAPAAETIVISVTLWLIIR
jgi:hypothetical protein